MHFLRPGELRAVAAATIEALDGSSRLVVELSKAGGEVVVVAVGVAAPGPAVARSVTVALDPCVAVIGDQDLEAVEVGLQLTVRRRQPEGVDQAVAAAPGCLLPPFGRKGVAYGRSTSEGQGRSCLA